MAVNSYNTVRDMHGGRAAGAGNRQQHEDKRVVPSVPKRPPPLAQDVENSSTRVAIVKPYMKKAEIEQQMKAKGLGINDSETLTVKHPAKTSDGQPPLTLAARQPLQEKKGHTQELHHDPLGTAAAHNKPPIKATKPHKALAIPIINNPGTLQHHQQQRLLSRASRYIINITTPEALQMIRLVDELNEDNPLHCTEYMEDIFKYMQESEQQDCYTIPRNYLVQHGAVSSYNRAVLVDWLVQVHMKLNLVQETLYIAIDVIDRFLKANRVEKKQLQLLGISSLFLASKYEELYPPCSADFSFLSANTFSAKQICEMEHAILNSLDYKMNKPFSLQFLRRFSKITNSSIVEHNMAKYILEKAMMDSELMASRPSLRAVAALVLAYQILNSKHGKETKQILEKYTRFSSTEIQEMKARLNGNLVVSSHSGLNSIMKKYESKDFLEVAKRPGAVVRVSTDKTRK